MTRMIPAAVIVMICVSASGAAQVPTSVRPGAVAQQSPRPDAQTPPQGTGQIRGRVVDAENGKPLRRALVRLFSGELRENRTSATDEQGRYEFKDLPASRYSISASKGSYVTLSYGQTRPFESGKPFELRDTQIVEKVDFSLPRGAVVTGRVVDELGDPAPNVQVMAMRYQFSQGQKRLSPSGGGATTDDLGEFRLYGLPPAQYYVSATARPMTVGAPAEQDREGYAATYYPGSTNPSEAQRVMLTLGQTLSDINITLVQTRTAQISGTAVDSKGRPMTGGSVTAFQTNMAFFNTLNGPLRPDGSFTINGVAPGEYQLRALGTGELATAVVTVASRDITDLRLVGDAPVTASGRVILDPPAASIVPSALRVSAMSMPTGGLMISFGVPGASSLQDDWSFAIKVQPGKSRISVSPMPAGWSIKAVRVNGVDVIDTGIDVKPGQDVTGIEIELTNRPASVSGTVLNSRGEPAKDYTVVVFARDEQRWTPATRYIMTARPDQDGRFKVTAPPGDYLSVALEYIESGQWTDPEFLKLIGDRATAFSLGEGETKTLSLKLIAEPR